jgi:mRNA interferase MazF
MGTFVKGDVVVTPFPFSDLSATKKRPALVVATLTGDDVILCQITSQSIADSYAIPLADHDLRAGPCGKPAIFAPTAFSRQRPVLSSTAQGRSLLRRSARF